MATKEDKELYLTLGQLLQSNKDIKEELQFIHKAILAEKGKIEALDVRVQSLEKRQYAAIVLASAFWGVVVSIIQKFFS